MGLDIQNLRAVLAAKASGADFTAAATLGRQTLMISEAEVRQVFGEFNLTVPREAGGLQSLLKQQQLRQPLRLPVRQVPQIVARSMKPWQR